MISKVPDTYWPKNSTPLWRYLSFDKFINFLIHREIQFTRATLFTDQNELRLQDPRNGRRDHGAMSTDFDLRVEGLRSRTFISCWSIGASESYPLWKIYLGGSRNGVAIRTTTGRLRSALEPCKRRYFEGGVRYRDTLFEGIPNDDQLICTKLEAYSYEKEYRVYTRDISDVESSSDPQFPFNSNTISEKVDVGSMLLYVYISPFSSEWFEKTVRDVMDKLAPDIDVPIRRSNIRDK